MARSVRRRRDSGRVAPRRPRRCERQDFPPDRSCPLGRVRRRPTQSYAFYLPRELLARARNWPLILAFDPGGRGRTPVERYQAAAEQYGYIVAGSNNSRNGCDRSSGRIIAALSADVLHALRDRPAAHLRRRDVRRRARRAVGRARIERRRRRRSRRAPAIRTRSRARQCRSRYSRRPAREDFNHLEMRQLDEALTTPHRLVVSSRAVTRGCRASWRPKPSSGWSCERFRTASCRSDPVEDRRALRATSGRGGRRALRRRTRILAARWMVDDFTGLKDVSKYAARAAALERSREVRDALKSDRDEDAREERTFNDVVAVERRLGSDEERTATLMQLRQLWRRFPKTPSARPTRRTAASRDASLRT